MFIFSTCDVKISLKYVVKPVSLVLVHSNWYMYALLAQINCNKMYMCAPQSHVHCSRYINYGWNTDNSWFDSR
jgi:hypothetical protein